MGSPSKQDIKKAKELAVLLLEAKGISYDDWLYEKHKEIERENPNVMEQALKLFINQKNNQKGGE